MQNPDLAKWLRARPQVPSGQTQTVAGAPAVYVCRPLACSGRAIVAVATAVSPTRHPERAALEKAAKLLPTQARAQDMMMEAASDGDDRLASLGSRVTELRGYPAIMAETKRTSHNKTSFTVRGDIFVGLVLVKMVSMAEDREQAKRNFDSFVAAIDIIDVEAGAPPAETTAAVSAAAPEQ